MRIGIKRLLVAATMVVCGGVGVGNSVMAQETSEDQERSENVETNVEAKVRAEVVDGKLKITLSNGKTETIDLGNVKGGGNIVIRSQSQSQSSDGEATQRSEAILVGPGGSQNLIFDGRLAETHPEILSFMFNSEDGVNGIAQLSPDASVGKFMIGVHCQPADKAMLAQLELSGGLLVQSVVEESPSQEAGVKQYDILVKANDQSLSEVQELTAAVQAAGDDEGALKIVLVRKGQEQEVTVTPIERAGQDIALLRDLVGDQRAILDLKVDNIPAGSHFYRVLPGLIQGQRGEADEIAIETTESVDAIDVSSIVKEMAELRKQVEQLRQELRNK